MKINLTFQGFLDDLSLEGILQLMTRDYDQTPRLVLREIRYQNCKQVLEHFKGINYSWVATTALVRGNIHSFQRARNIS